MWIASTTVLLLFLCVQLEIVSPLKFTTIIRQFRFTYYYFPPSLSPHLYWTVCPALTEAEEGTAGVAQSSPVFPGLRAGAGKTEIGGAGLLQQVAPAGVGQRRLGGGRGPGNEQGLPQYIKTLGR